MRLQHYEVDAIKSAVHDIFGQNTKTILFGSRVNDNLKGGDIDLFILPCKAESLEILFDKKIEFLVSLKSKIGEQKIDVVIAKNKNRLIEQEALKNGVLL
ncbi:MAG: nucleotidyltransferase domain-containing protein [Candidatus Marinimicrobia bacterium]|nr:nucleotidyltransferase domain-containing protein [Candidatus Neomarinimicrobiota bacterium]